MSRTPHSLSPRLTLVLAALSAGLFLAGCSGANEPATSEPVVVAGMAPSTAPDPTVTSTTPSVPISARPVATTATTSAAPPADLDQSLAGIDRALADLDHQLTDADHDVATPEGDIR
jgi:hypothetical protein